jgi:hypothetical protein
VGEYFCEREVNGGDGAKGIWWMDFIYLYEIYLYGLKAMALSEVGKVSRGRDSRGDLTNV